MAAIKKLRGWKALQRSTTSSVLLWCAVDSAGAWLTRHHGPVEWSTSQEQGCFWPSGRASNGGGRPNQEGSTRQKDEYLGWLSSCPCRDARCVLAWQTNKLRVSGFFGGCSGAREAGAIDSLRDTTQLAGSLAPVLGRHTAAQLPLEQGPPLRPGQPPRL
ncbi:hypothetical protein MAPG_06278 [Magnaporthiopsis poae ATCC 64411]|uniref:Uncharacterized protein n=1 Tax=Magnaporthiopsis poae (strain ATCC 64411 / 73-15) TaxID=644358 RepID=A0A0C4E1L4_MAGP6|nr:hypothetical protein MAPG_06278 [Magnaporthiopsis poae ATCC 64411]